MASAIVLKIDFAPALWHNNSNSSGSYTGGLPNFVNSLYINNFKSSNSFVRSHPETEIKTDKLIFFIELRMLLSLHAYF